MSTAAQQHRVDERRAASWPGWAVRTAWVLVAAGAVLRIARYAAERDYWLDELFLVWNIRDRSLWQLLFEPLLYRQAAPPGFLVLEKLAFWAMGAGEWALRLVPLMAGLLALVLFSRLASSALSWRGGLAAVALFSLLEPLIYYSSEAKQYGVDVLVAVETLLVAWPLMDRKEAIRAGQLWVLGAVGVVGMLFSHPGVFVFAGMVAALMLAHARQRRWHDVRRLALVATIVAVAFCLNYVLLLLPLVGNEGLRHHWDEGFMPYSFAAIPWLWHCFYGLFADPATMWLPEWWASVPYVWLGILLCLVGVIALCRRDATAAALLLMPILFTLGASALHAYPFSGRLVLFLVPCVVLLIGAGIEGTWKLRRHWSQVLGPMVLALTLAPLATRSAAWLVHAPGREEIRPALAFIQRHLRAGDELYVYHAADTAFLHYRGQFHLDGVPWRRGIRAPGGPEAYAADLSQLRGHPRVWVLFCHVWRDDQADEESLLVSALDGLGRRLTETHTRGAGAYLYDLSD